MKRIVGGLAVLLLMLSGCGGESEAQAEQILAKYAAMESCEMEAAVKCEYGGELKEYTMRCSYAAEGESTVTVLAPEALAGLSAVFGDEGCSLCYEDYVLDAGTLGQSRLSPAESLPLLVDALRKGYLLEQSRESVNGEEGLRICMETEEEGTGLYWTVWMKADGTPFAAEVSEKNELIFRMEFTAFSFGAILNME